MTNAKTIAFFTAFLPQFVDPQLPAAHQLAVMCAVSVAMAAITGAGWAVAAGAGRALFLKQAPARWLGMLSGIVLIGGGIWLSLTHRSTQ
jgi:homoserine/homoserine lactone efflux protein